MVLAVHQLLLDHVPHHVGDVQLVGALAVLAVEAVRIEQGLPDLEVLLLAVVRGGGHQQEVPVDAAEQISDQKAFGLVDLATEVVGGGPVGLVNHYQVFLAGLELGLK